MDWPSIPLVRATLRGERQLSTAITDPFPFSAAAAFALIAALLTIPTNVAYTLASAGIAALASFISLIAFAVDIALYVHVKNQMSKLTQGLADTDTTPGTSMGQINSDFALIALHCSLLDDHGLRHRAGSILRLDLLGSQRGPYVQRFQLL